MNAAPLDALEPRHRPYQPYGAALEFFYCRAPECLLAGPAGTGKSVCALNKLYLCAEKYPGMRALVVRKTRESLTESALVSWESLVLPEGHPALAGPQRRLRQAYHFPNGSEIVLGGMDKPSKVMSTEYDLVYVQEAVELAEEDWEALTTRLRHGRMPYQQILGDTNPSAPTHWLKRRADAGRLTLLESRHEDNPALWDRARRRWTPAGASYLAKLDALTGARRLRLREGRWVQAEGVVYEGWDPALHLVTRFPVPAAWPRYLGVDFGYTNPTSVGWWAEDPDGRLYLYREVYHTGVLVEDHARRVRQLSAGEPPPRAIVCDHDAEDRATLERHLGRLTTPALKDVSPGIQAVAARLRPARDGRPRLFLLRDSLDRRDPALVEAKRPASGLEEFDAYCWAAGTAAARKGDVPLKEHDHFMDQMRYVVAYRDLTPRAGAPAAGGTRPSFEPPGVRAAGRGYGGP